MLVSRQNFILTFLYNGKVCCVLLICLKGNSLEEKMSYFSWFLLTSKSWCSILNDLESLLKAFGVEFNLIIHFNAAF